MEDLNLMDLMEDLRLFPTLKILKNLMTVLNALINFVEKTHSLAAILNSFPNTYREILLGLLIHKISVNATKLISS